MQVKDGIQIELTKDFGVSAEVLYKAWTTEDGLKQWWHPMGNTLRGLTNELRDGGKVEYQFSTAEGEEAFTISGVYKEVLPVKKLVYTWNWKLPSPSVQDTDFLLTIEFTSTGSGSSLHVMQENFTSEEAVQPHREGWENALQDLAAYLQKQ
ncbi:MAG TPA: SRPBCC domain-containing protein [Flavisolibacter sp.]|jgi:uncharacterized protein YndB with AHSA1/START domain|nr:SRPBCC domain-containing protein [Flavisolibacter sp.]